MNDRTQLPYDPNRMIDTVIELMGLKNDSALCKALGTHPPILSKIRHRVLPVGATFIVAMHELTGWKTKHLRELMGDRRSTFRGFGNFTAKTQLKKRQHA